MFCAILYHLYSFKTVKNTYGRLLLLVKLQAGYQIAQRITMIVIVIFCVSTSHPQNCRIFLLLFTNLSFFVCTEFVLTKSV